MSEETLCLQELGRLPPAIIDASDRGEVSESENIPQQNATKPTPKQIIIDQRRKNLINTLIENPDSDMDTIAQQLGVERTTLYRDFEEIAKTELPQYLLMEWVQFSQKVKAKNPYMYYSGLTKVIIKLLEKQAKLEVNLTQNNQTNILTKVVSSIDLSKLTENDRNAILAAEEAYTRAETSISPQ